MSVATQSNIEYGRWPAVLLEDACSLITDGTHKTPTYAEEGFVFLSSKNVVSGKIDWENVKKIPDWLHAELHGRLSPQKGDLLLAKNGTTGVAAVVDREAVFDIYVSLALLRPKPNVLPEYLHRALNSPLAKKQFNGALKGIGVPNLHLKDIRRAVIPLPPLAEQRRIAEVLDRAEALRAKRRAALAQLDSLTQSLFLDLFGDPVVNRKGFPVSRMGDVCDVRDGTHDSPKYVSDGGYPLVTSKNLSGGFVDLSDVNLISEADYIQINKRSKVDRGDIIMPMIGTIGSPVLVENEPQFAIKNVALIKFTSASPLPILIRHLLSCSYFDHIVGQKNRGGTQKFVSLGDLRSFPLPIPPIEQQREFARRVTAVEVLKKAQRAALAELDALFATLQHRAFRGEL